MSQELPVRTREYRNHHLDSTLWDKYAPRPDDIVISTSYKSGTTWTQSIVRELIVYAMGQVGVDDPAQLPLPDSRSSIWLDARWGDSVEKLDKVAAQPHRRFLKTHLPLDGLTFYPQVKYIVIGRDPRDVFMSLWNHYNSYGDQFYAMINDDPELPGEPCPRCPEDIHQFWAEWIGHGWFAWEQEGYPFWGNLHHAQTWWDHRHLENILFLHYADMLAAPAREVRRIAQFLEIDLSDDIIEDVVENTTLTAMRQRAAERDQTSENHAIWKGGAASFFHKGTNGRWRDVLTEAELGMYEETMARVLTPECARWLTEGDHTLA